MTWIPHYLTWPWWPDQDSYATMALGWERGKLPYRDVASNNFPGQIYLMWGLGKAFGWGRTMPFLAADATLVVALGLMMLVWSRRCFGRLLPGLVGYLAFLSYYLGLDYTQVAQRDWQGPFFVVAAILLVQAWPTRAARLAAAAAAAAGMTFRPQVVLLLPALALAMDEGVRRPGEGVGKLVRPLLEWSLAFAACIGLAFAPLAMAGVLGDFLGQVREVGYGGSYSRLTPAGLVKKFVSQKPLMQVLATPVLLVHPRRPGGGEGEAAGQDVGRGRGGRGLLHALEPRPSRLSLSPALAGPGSRGGGAGGTDPGGPRTEPGAPPGGRAPGVGAGGDDPAAFLRPGGVGAILGRDPERPGADPDPAGLRAAPRYHGFRRPPLGRLPCGPGLPPTIDIAVDLRRQCPALFPGDQRADGAAVGLPGRVDPRLALRTSAVTTTTATSPRRWSGSPIRSSSGTRGSGPTRRARRAASFTSTARFGQIATTLPCAATLRLARLPAVESSGSMSRTPHSVDAGRAASTTTWR